MARLKPQSRSRVATHVVCRPIIASLLIFLSVGARAAEPWEEAKAILHERCTKCHGGVKHKGGLDLRSAPNILRGGDSGPAAVPGDPEESLLMEVLYPDADPSMPPKGERLSTAEVETIARWIRSLAEPVTEETISLPEGMPPRVVIDFLVSRAWQETQVIPSTRIGDGDFVRRAYLHLLGRIPTEEERHHFLQQSSSGKREALVDHLLAQPAFARHFAEIFDTIFLGRRHGLVGRERPAERGDDWHAYLRWVFESNRPWNRVAHDLLESRAEEGPARGARWYLAAHGDKHEEMAKAVAPALLGKQIACAQCHNHPLVPEIEQRHYWGLVAFFKRSFTVETQHGTGLGEAAVGGDLKFSSLEGDSYEAKLTFFTGETIVEPDLESAHDATLYRIPPSEEFFQRLEKKENDENDGKKRRRTGTLKMDKVPVPLFSRREALAGVAVENYPDFAKALVNRIWALLLGRGLVHPIDHVDSVHPPSHPELLDWLGKDFAAEGFDVKRLIREIMASKVYQLSSEPATDQRPPDDSFACGLISPLSAEALYRSMLVAGGHAPDADGSFPGIDEETYREAFARIYPDLFPETFSPRSAEGMFFTNNPLMNDINIREFDPSCPPSRAVEALFLIALGREPDEEERSAGMTFLGQAPDTERQRGLLWALITSSEFRFNH